MSIRKWIINVFFISCILLFMGALIVNPLQAQTKRSLVIGISDYESADEINVWPNIHGTHDALLMDTCLHKCGFTDRVLLLDAEATHDRILHEFQLLVQRTLPGDTVFFHFSGHGQPFEDLDGDEGSGDGWDESIVPYDALRYYEEDGYKGENHITDDCLHDLLLKIRKKAGSNGMVFAVVDACYSGSVMRGEDDKENHDSSIIGFCVNGYKAFSPMIERSTFRLLEVYDDCANILSVEASLPFRRTREIKIGGQYYGPLSYYTTRSLELFPLGRMEDWLQKLNEFYRSDERLSREVIYCESTIY